MGWLFAVADVLIRFRVSIIHFSPQKIALVSHLRTIFRLLFFNTLGSTKFPAKGFNWIYPVAAHPATDTLSSGNDARDEFIHPDEIEIRT